MTAERATADSVLHTVCLALTRLLGSEVTVTVLACDEATVARFDGVVVRAFELPGRESELLVVDIGAGCVQVRPDEVEDVDWWSVPIGAEFYTSVGISLLNGCSLLIQENLNQAFA